MKFLHLSDLHIGKRLREQSLMDDQRYILDEILKIAADEKPDGVIIAGDIYDKSVPSAEAVQLFDEFLCSLARRECPVLLISGASIPAEGLPHGLYLLGKLLPSSNGVEGFLRIQTMGASLSEVWAPYCTLWVLMLVFFVLACLGLRRVISREMRAAQTETAEPAAEA